MEPIDNVFTSEYEVEVGKGACDGNSIVYLPSHRGRSYVTLTVIKHLLPLTHPPHMKHIAIFVSSDIFSKQLEMMLKRHLPENAVEPYCDTDENATKEESIVHNGVVVIPRSALQEHLKSKEWNIKSMALLVVFDCERILQDSLLQQVMVEVEQLKSENQPQFLGLTSSIVDETCSEGDVKQMVQKLEEIYHSSLVSVGNLPTLLKVIDRPSQLFSVSDPFVANSGDCLEALNVLDKAIKDSVSFDFKFNGSLIQVLRQEKAEYKLDIPKTLSEIKKHMAAFGEYGASKAVAPTLADLERIGMLADDDLHTRLMLKHIVCSLTAFRKILENDMFRVQLSERAERFSSQKIQNLLVYLAAMSKGQRTIIYVEDVRSASILTGILQDLVHRGRKINHIKVELMMGGRGISSTDTWADTLAWQRNMEVITRFVASETNTLVLSGDIEGLDLPKCDFFFMLGEIKTFPQYMETKNRVKSNGGKLVLFVEHSRLDSYEKEIEAFQRTEMELRKILVKNQHGVEIDWSYEISDVEDDESKLGSETVVKATMDTALSIINRYCLKLPGDRYTCNRPSWWKEELEAPSGKSFVVHVRMPMASPLQETIKGNPMSTLESAVQAAALKVCDELQKMKELSKHLDPVSDIFETGIGDHLLPHGSPHDIEDTASSFYGLYYPEALEAARCKVGQDTYVHRLSWSLLSERPPPGDNRKTTIFELLSDKGDFAILSVKPLPKLCQFPIFMNGHTLSVSVETSEQTVTLSQEQLDALHDFHCGIFINVSRVVQCFMLFDKSNTHNSYYVAPLTPDGEINWEIIKNHTTIPEVLPPSEEESGLITCTPETHERTIVMPWYRSVQEYQIYLIVEVCTNMTADSYFPTEEFETFHDYFYAKYNLKLKQPDLPMLEVVLLNTRVNGLVPRARTKKLRRDEKLEEFREHMVPELCTAMNFPAALWIKLIALPSVLHRLNSLLVAFDLRENIYSEANVGNMQLVSEMLPVDPDCDHPDEIQEPKAPPSAVKRGLVIGNVKLEERKRDACLRKPWGGEQEPIDIHRNIDSLNLVEIRYHDAFVKKSLSPHASFSHQMPKWVPDTEKEENVFHDSKINLLHASYKEPGPQLWEVFQALSLPSTNDVLNLNRIRILGSAFLNLAVSVYLSTQMPRIASARVNQLRKKILSPQNLVWCAEERHICGKLKAVDFAAGEWIPPSFCTAPMLAKKIIDRDIRPSVLQNISLTEKEQNTGELQSDTDDYIEEILTSYKSRETSILNRDEVYLGRHYVPAVSVVKCVEAIVGTYFKTCGWQCALKVVGWLQVLPSEKLSDLLDEEEPPELHQNFPSQTPEKILGYEFRDKRLLLQALTHESFLNPSSHGSMDSLVTLGEGVLDFLITSYIYEKCSHMNPKNLAGLRDALVSRTTYAALVVRYNLHRFLLLNSPLLLESIDHFIKFQESLEFSITDEVRILLEEHDCENIERVEVPTVVGNLLASLAGAVFLDTGKNFQCVWNVFHPLFLKEMSLKPNPLQLTQLIHILYCHLTAYWSEDVPLSIVDLLYDLAPAPSQVMITHEKDDSRGDVKVTCKVRISDDCEEVFLCRGADLYSAKTLAAKLALRALLGSPESSIEM